jgi:hypothetical protein
MQSNPETSVTELRRNRSKVISVFVEEVVISSRVARCSGNLASDKLSLALRAISVSRAQALTFNRPGINWHTRHILLFRACTVVVYELTDFSSLNQYRPLQRYG